MLSAEKTRIISESWLGAFGLYSPTSEDLLAGEDEWRAWYQQIKTIWREGPFGEAALITEDDFVQYMLDLQEEKEK